ncbi:MAG TPA: hypothetical protein VGO66_04000 [Solirubrobacterales bacterium]|nr:hypothetical protein [Solirubrobacterales bacterium]
MPTKRKRHMITETVEIETALEPLRAQGIPVNFQRLVVKGAEATMSEHRALAEDAESRLQARERFLDWTREGAPGLDLDTTRSAWKRPSIEKLLEDS